MLDELYEIQRLLMLDTPVYGDGTNEREALDRVDALIDELEAEQ